MTLALAVLVTLAVVLGVVHAVARANVRRIQGNPDPYPITALNREPDGEETFIARPDGTRLRVKVTGGSGPTVVFVHGFTGSLLEWNVIWTSLQSSDYRLVAYDHRGHGQSTIGADGIGSPQMASDLCAVLEHFDVHDAVLVGHSMGGFVALTSMLAYPQGVSSRLRHGVLLASFAGDILRGAPQNRLQVMLLQTGLLQRLCRSQTYGWALTASFYGSRPAPSAVEVYRRVLLGQPLRELIPILRDMIKENHYTRLHEISVPCTVLCGARDRTSPSWHTDALHGGLAGSRLERIEHVGHMLNWEAAERVVALVRVLSAPTRAATPPSA